MIGSLGYLILPLPIADIVILYILLATTLVRLEENRLSSIDLDDPNVVSLAGLYISITLISKLLIVP